MKHKKYIIANWKMNPQTKEGALRLINGMAAHRFSEDIKLIVAPPFIYLDFIKKSLKKEISLAAQDVSWAERGAYTGEISGLMLKNLGCDYVLIGHSERRYKIGETNEIINLKLKASLKAGLNPILAVGEKEQNDDFLETLKSQIKNGLKDIEAPEIGRLIFAYEPVWAIGTGIPDTPDHALSAALLIRKIVGGLYAPDLAEDLPILYGGSVSAQNAADFISQSGIDGALVGSASLETDNFIKIIKSTE